MNRPKGILTLTVNGVRPEGVYAASDKSHIICADFSAWDASSWSRATLSLLSATAPFILKVGTINYFETEPAFREQARVQNELKKAVRILAEVRGAEVVCLEPMGVCAAGETLELPGDWCVHDGVEISARRLELLRRACRKRRVPLGDVGFRRNPSAARSLTGYAWLCASAANHELDWTLFEDRVKS